jgi:putative solute:sodium symporter small subunit
MIAGLDQGADSGWTMRNAAPVRMNKGVRPMEPNGGRHWRRTSTLMWIMMALWLIFSFVIHMFAEQLNGIKIIGFPLGFYMAAQGSLIVFVVMLFVFAKVQDNIDREEGVAEED